MGTLYKIWAIAQIYGRWMIKSKLFYLYLTVFLPLTLVIPIRVLAYGKLYPYLTTGTIVFTITMNALTTANQDIATDKVFKRAALIITRPITSTTYFLGLLLSNAMQIIPATIMVISILNFITVFRVQNWILFLISMAMGWYTSVLLGFIIGVTVGTRNYQLTILIGNVSSFILSFLAPVYYPMEALPVPLRYLALLLFTTHVANLINLSYELESSLGCFPSLLYLVILMSILTIFILPKVKLKDFY